MSWFTKKVPAVVAPEKGPPAAVEQIGWISVRDQIPEFEVRVLVYCPDHGVLNGRRTSQTSDGDEWRLGCMDSTTYSIYPYEARSKKVTHWMPLPPRPQA